MLTFRLFRVLIDIGMVRFVSEGIQNRIQNDYFGGAILEKVLHQRPLFGGANLEAPRLSAVFCRYTTHTIPYYGSFNPPPRVLSGKDLSLLFPCHSNHMPTRVQEDHGA